MNSQMRKDGTVIGLSCVEEKVVPVTEQNDVAVSNITDSVSSIAQL